MAQYVRALRAPAVVACGAVTASIEIVDEATDEVVEALARLLPQLSSSPPPTSAELGVVIGDPDTWLYVARVDDRIVGSLTLAMFRSPTALKAWIEDVVVDEAARGHGVGEALNRAALATAAERGAKSVSLTSRPSREAANRLYQRIGFQQRDTNVYRYDL